MVGVSKVQFTLKQHKLGLIVLALLTILSVVTVRKESSPLERTVERELWGKKAPPTREEIRARAKKQREKKQRKRRQTKKRQEKFQEREMRKAWLAAKKQLYLCIGFPNAGAENIVNSVAYATGESMASNYGNEIYDENFKMTVGVYEAEKLLRKQFIRGPWLQNHGLPPPSSKKVLVRSNCGGFCTRFGEKRCRADDEYFEGLRKSREFKLMCASGRVAGNHFNSMYSKKSARPGVMVIRNPIDIVLAGFKEHSLETGGKYTQEQLYKYCAKLDRIYRDTEELATVRSMILLKDFFPETGETPICYAEFYRIVKWYSFARTMYRDSAIKLYYEDLLDPEKLDSSVSEVLTFMNMTRGHSGTDYPFDNPSIEVTFTEEDTAMLKQYLAIVTRGDLRDEMEHYYE